MEKEDKIAAIGVGLIVLTYFIFELSLKLPG